MGARILQNLPATNAKPKHLADLGLVPDRRARFRYTHGNCKMETLASSFWVRLHFVAALIWLTIAAHETFAYQISPEGQIKLIVSAAIIIAMAKTDSRPITSESSPNPGRPPIPSRPATPIANAACSSP